MNRPSFVSAVVGAVLAGVTSASAASTPSLASERHARCGFDREVAAVQVSNQRVNHDILRTEPPPRNLAQLGCYDQVRGVMASITAFGTLPGPVGNLLTSFACSAIQSSIGAVQQRFNDFYSTPFGRGVAAGVGAAQGQGAALPIAITPSTFLSAPPAPVQPVSNPIFNSQGPSAPAGQAAPVAPRSLPQGSSTNIFGGQQ